MIDRPHDDRCQRIGPAMFIGVGLISAVGSLAVLTLRENLTGPLWLTGLVGVFGGLGTATLGCFQGGFFRTRTPRRNAILPPVEMGNRNEGP